MKMLVSAQPAEDARQWGTGNATGRTQARIYIERAQATGETASLFAALREMVKDGRCTGHEVGFLQEIAKVCATAAPRWEKAA